jgi:hypothetical protein
MCTKSPSAKAATGDNLSLEERQDQIVHHLRQQKPDLLQRLFVFLKQLFGQR